MKNSIEINGIKITATFVNGVVMVSFDKDGKIIKECDKYEVSRFVKPENLKKVQAIIEAEENSEEAKAYYSTYKAEADKQEADYQNRTGHYDAHKANMTKVMSY